MGRANEDISNMGLSIEMDQNEGLETQIEEGMRVGLSDQVRQILDKERSPGKSPNNKGKTEDRAMRKEKGKEVFRNDESIANLSLSDSDISNKRKFILKKVQKTWEVGKIGF
ncbi:hypothetical protein PVK06_007625 [Gossypium arboreum]|uniref:Uncharacterized protein n=1 Tax=Gossypium arboreum TaxID=29729 RepID=A0ABR0QIN0_GOSAR|nr:hypothetical protein PVK06_007625 [Gossypium arboreum]